MYEHHNFFYFFRNRELNELFISMAIRTFAISLAGIFLPMYLYQLGYSISSILFFFAFMAFFSLVLLFPALKISYRFGLKHTILFSMPFLIIFFLLIFSLEYYNWPLIILAFFAGLHGALFWFAYHEDFSKFSNKKNRGSQVGFLIILTSIFAALGPIAGALIITFLGFNVLFIIVSVLLLGSTFPLFLTKEIHVPIQFSFEDIFKYSNFKDKIAYMGSGIEARLVAIIWPLFIFIFIFNEVYLSLGLFSSITFFSSLVFVFLSRKYSDIHRRLLLKIGTVSNSIVWFVKSFLVTPIQVFIIGIFYGASKASIDVSFTALNYDKTNKRNRAKIIFQREVFMNLGATIFLFILAFASDYMLEAIRYGVSLSSLMMFFF